MSKYEWELDGLVTWMEKKALHGFVGHFSNNGLLNNVEK